MNDEPEEQLDQDEQYLALPQEQAIEQRPVSFMGDDLAAAGTAAGEIFITLPGMCRTLGLFFRAQLRRIERTPSLVKGLRVIPIETIGGVQLVNCLRVDRVALWLGGIETSRIKPEYRAKVEAYQDELAPVAMQVFMRVLGVQTPAPAVPPTKSTGISAEIVELRGQIEALTGVTNLMQEHLANLLAAQSQMWEFGGELSEQMSVAIGMLENLAKSQESAADQTARRDDGFFRLTPAHARAIQEQVETMIRETRQLPTPLTHTMIYSRLKQTLNADSYAEIPDERYEEILNFLLEELRRALAGEAPEQGSLF